LNSIESVTRFLQLDDRILKRRCRFLHRDLIDLGEILRHGGFKRRLEVLDLYFVERRHSAVRTNPFLQKRIHRRSLGRTARLGM
jgi:hypothetical protein